MPPKRKALEPANPNVASPPDNGKKTKTAVSNASSQPAQDLDAILNARLARRSGRWSKVSGSKNIDVNYWIVMKDPSYAFEFRCICNPSRDDEDDDDESDSDEEDDGEAQGTANKKNCDGGKTCFCGKPAASLPSHPYTISRAGLYKHHTSGEMADLRDPDAFDMYTFNDHASYGVLEVVQNLILDFDEALNAKEWREAWAVTEGLVFFMLHGRGDMMAMADDGDMIKETATLIARLALTALAMVEDEGHFANDSEVKNIGYIISLYSKLADNMREMSLLEEPRPSKANTFKFNGDNLDLYLLSYAKRGGITVPNSDKSNEVDITMPKSDAKDPWGWKKGLADYKHGRGVPSHAYRRKHSTSIGGDGLDVTTWTSAERKKAHFKNKDPLSKAMMAKIKEGLVFSLR